MMGCLAGMEQGLGMGAACDWVEGGHTAGQGGLSA